MRERGGTVSITLSPQTAWKAIRRDSLLVSPGFVQISTKMLVLFVELHELLAVHRFSLI
jgi:hypothetical protein